MQLHNIKPKTKPKKRRYIGHGGKKGTYSGKGIKGQRSRAGARIRPQIQDLIKRIPKMRGYDRAAIRRKKKTIILDLEILEKKFDSGSVISRETLAEAGLLKDKNSPIKILSDGHLTKSFTVASIPASKKTIDKIIKAGGNYA